MPRSAVAGILSPDGGLRTVVTQRWRMRDHLKRGEQLFVVPGLLVDEPVPWGEEAALIRQVHRHVVRTLAPENSCGECRECCVTLYIAPGNGWTRPAKPSHVACEWCDKEVGCLVHFNRPAPCRKFECLWLKSQDRNWRMGPELRPDRCGVILTGPDTDAGDPEWIRYAHPSIHKPISEAMIDYIREVESDGTRVVNVTRYTGETHE